MTGKVTNKKASLGQYLSNLRTMKGFTLREVEDATNKEVSNAYLSQLENGRIMKPSPNILYSLANIYGVRYEDLMKKAGYIIASSEGDKTSKGSRIAAFANEKLTSEEEEELLNYLAFLRSKKKGR